ncbi:hypothetical protein OAI64_02505 [Schleiferiaceae bacterium]|nr:hypothetical protein [Schleiferiaceae bacterium]
MTFQSTFILLPYRIKYLTFQVYSYLTYRKRYAGKFDNYLNFFLEGKCQCLVTEDTPVFLTNEVKLLYGLTEEKLIKDFDIIDRVTLKEMLIMSDFYNKIIYNTSLKTSGTTGSALIVPIDSDFLRFKFASFYFFKSIHNSGWKVKSGNFFGRKIIDIKSNKPPYWLKSIFTNQVLFSQYHINEYSIKFYIEAIERFNLRTLHGYPSVLAIFAEIVKKLSLEKEVHDLELRNITVGSENLSDAQRNLIEKTFNCKVLNFYGQTESVVDIFECENGSLHINESFSFVELIETNESGVYRLIGTQLKNRKFPLIRYDTGDLVEYDSSLSCDCGRSDRIIKSIVGRNEDFLVLSNGNRIGRLDHIFKDSIDIVECQIIQNVKGEAIFKIVRGKNFIEKDEINLRQSIRTILGDDFKYEIRYLDSIEKTKNGKLKQVINNIT